jgi:hypothetical protein
VHLRRSVQNGPDGQPLTFPLTFPIVEQRDTTDNAGTPAPELPAGISVGNPDASFVDPHTIVGQDLSGGSDAPAEQGSAAREGNVKSEANAGNLNFGNVQKIQTYSTNTVNNLRKGAMPPGLDNAFSN